MSSAITNWPLSLEQFLALPEAEPALEVGPAGKLVQKVSATTEHAALQIELVVRLEVHARPRRLGRVFTEQRLVLGRVARVPERRRITMFSSTAEEVFAADEVLPPQAYLPGLRLTPAELFAALEP